jgi:pyrroline-5-carboxylate reductase
VSDPAAAEVPGLLLVGCGKMGGALLAGWLERGLARRLVVVEPGPGAVGFAGRPGVERLSDAAAVAPDFQPSVVVLAVKPQAMADVLPPYRRFADAGALFLSIAAGKTLGFFARALGNGASVVRAMPNTPASIGRGIAVACANARVRPEQRRVAEALLAAVGDVGWVEDEALLDAVTAVSGSGPAYVFLLIECLARAGVAAGLPEALAERLARATVAGSGELARRSAESAASLRENVTSPGGTTRAALDVLMAVDGLDPLLRRAVLAATKRSRELAD